ncbi:MAG: hypothetical protein ACLRV9_00720 [Clostridium sp.]
MQRHTANTVNLILTYLILTMFINMERTGPLKAWGYTVDDARWLQAEIEKQALEKYIAGEYTLGKLNKDGQRISVRIEIPRKNGGRMVSFLSGWMVYPNGSLRLTTPYGGK